MRGPTWMGCGMIVIGFAAVLIIAVAAATAQQ